MTRTTQPDPAENFLARVSLYDGGMYGGVVGDLSDDERTKALAMHADSRTAVDVARQILRDRGLYPQEPDPRTPYPVWHGARGLPNTDGFGRAGRHRRR